MRKLLALLVLCAATFLSGCGMVYSYNDRVRRVKTINSLQARMGIDDHDAIWLYDRPSYLSYWYVREVEHPEPALPRQSH